MKMEDVPGIGKEDDLIELPPGFRFHPTDEELISHYLQRKVMDANFSSRAIGEVDLNKSEPWELPMKAKMGEKEWYFFCVKDRKYPTGMRTNRATVAGYWKATGKDKEIRRGKSLIGMKKTLVFYRGRAPKGEKTNWVMHEYRLDRKLSHHNLPETAKNEWVIGRVYEKTPGGKKIHISGCSLPPLMDSSPQATKATPLVELPDVPCFSNPLGSSPAPANKESTDPFGTNTNPMFSTPSAVPGFPVLGSLYPAQPIPIPIPIPPNLQLQFHDLTSVLTDPGISPAVTSLEPGWRVTHRGQHQQYPSTSAAGPADLDFPWNY